MSNWRDRILREFTPNVCRLTLVADPDGLLLEEGVLAGIHERGFELIPFEDPIAAPGILWPGLSGFERPRVR